MIDAKILGIQASIIIHGFPIWHISQLQDLLTMVEEFGMPHFLKTLTIDEIHKYRNIKNSLTSCFFDYKILRIMYNGDPHMQFLPYKKTHHWVAPLTIASRNSLKNQKSPNHFPRTFLKCFHNYNFFLFIFIHCMP